MKKAEIPCPEVVLLKKHILVMSFIGKDHVPAPKLKDAMLNSEDLKKAYYQVLHVRTPTGSRLCQDSIQTSDSFSPSSRAGDAAAVSGV